MQPRSICACGCARPLRPSADPRTRYASHACRQRALRRRQRAAADARRAALARSAGLQEDLAAIAAALQPAAEVWARVAGRLVRVAGVELDRLRHLVALAQALAPALAAAERGPVAVVFAGEEITQLTLGAVPPAAARPPRGRSCACGCGRPVQLAAQARYASPACRVAGVRQRAATRRGELHKDLGQLLEALRAGGELRTARGLHRAPAPAGEALATTAVWARRLHQALAAQPAEGGELLSLAQLGEVLAAVNPATAAALSGPDQGPRDPGAEPQAGPAAARR